jgi:hypothetical protein
MSEDERQSAYLGLMAVLVVSWLGYVGWLVWEARCLKRDQAKFRTKLLERADFGQWENET